MSYVRNRYLFLLGGALFFLLILLFLFGPLFPWSPVKIGYTQLKSEKAIVIIRDPGRLHPSYSRVTGIMKELERQHGLEYKKPVKIIVCLSDKGRMSEMGRFLLWMSGYAVGGAALETGDALFINHAKMLSGKRNEEEYIRHELSHSLLQQNTGLLKARRITLQHWVSEGTATYFGGPVYMAAEEFRRQFKEKELIYNERGGDIYSNLEPLEPKFNYTMYKYFIKHLIDSYGFERFQKFLRLYIRDPGRNREIFQKVFGVELKKALLRFEQEYRS